MENRDATKEEWRYIEELVKGGKTIPISTEVTREEQLLELLVKNKELVEKYIGDGKDINIRYYGEESLLHVACRFSDNKEVVEYLLDKGANINAKCNRGGVPLHIACGENCKDIVELLLDRGADINARSDNGITPLHCACSVGNRYIVELLVHRGADVNIKSSNGSSPLYNACYNGHKEIVEFLIKFGADINIVDRYRSSLLHIAYSPKRRKKEIVKLLIDKGANINAVNENGESLLSMACYSKDKEMVKLLLDKNANVNVFNKVGDTPLHIACYNDVLNLKHIEDQKEIVEMLIEKGADINIKGGYGDTPLAIARRNGYKDIVNIIEKEKEKIKRQKKEKALGDLLNACKNGDKNGVEDLLKHISELSDDVLIKMINVSDYEILKVLIKNFGYIRMGKILNKIENEDKCRDIVNEIYMRISLSHVSGKAEELLREKKEECIIDICKGLGNIKYLNSLLCEVNITNNFLVKIINVSRDDRLRIVLRKVGASKVSDVFGMIDEDRRDIVVKYLYRKKNILKQTKGEIKEVLDEKIKNELKEEAKNPMRREYKKILLDTGISPNFLGEVAKTDVQEKIVPMNICVRVEENTTLIEAIFAGDEEKIRLLKHNKDEINRVDANEKNALMCAIEKCKDELAKELIMDNQLNVNAKDKNGKSVLMYAIEKENIDIIEMLINRGADVNAKDNKNKSVLMYALQKGASTVVIIDSLIKNASYKDKDKRGASILMYACLGGYMPAVNRLVEMIPEKKKSRILDYEIKETTALRLAAENNNEEMVKYLLKNGASNYGKLSGDKLNKLMKWWGEVDQKEEYKNNAVIEQVHITWPENSSVSRLEKRSIKGKNSI